VLKLIEKTQVKCLHCNEIFQSGLYSQHFVKCPSILVECDAKDEGCNSSISRKDAANHAENCNVLRLKNRIKDLLTGNEKLVKDLNIANVQNNEMKGVLLKERNRSKELELKVEELKTIIESLEIVEDGEDDDSVESFKSLRYPKIKKENYCETCTIQFRNQSSYFNHVRDNHPECVEECKFCKARCKDANSLQKHIIRLHSNDNKGERRKFYTNL